MKSRGPQKRRSALRLLSRRRIANSESVRQPPSGKHLLQRFQRRSQNCRAYVPQSFDEPNLVQRPELVQKNQPALSLKSNSGFLLSIGDELQQV